mmetsp:Transcript_6927/g.11168  ORF Transcript_6927/g.11168 Transcript_6927/m.11168 type:complete len:395 (+) Transcript_6927:260-1444(+)
MTFCETSSRTCQRQESRSRCTEESIAGWASPKLVLRQTKGDIPASAASPPPVQPREKRLRPAADVRDLFRTGCKLCLANTAGVSATGTGTGCSGSCRTGGSKQLGRDGPLLLLLRGGGGGSAGARRLFSAGMRRLLSAGAWRRLLSAGARQLLSRGPWRALSAGNAHSSPGVALYEMAQHECAVFRWSTCSALCALHVNRPNNWERPDTRGSEGTSRSEAAQRALVHVAAPPASHVKLSLVKLSLRQDTLGAEVRGLAICSVLVRASSQHSSRSRSISSNFKASRLHTLKHLLSSTDPLSPKARATISLSRLAPGVLQALRRSAAWPDPPPRPSSPEALRLSPPRSTRTKCLGPFSATHFQSVSVGLWKYTPLDGLYNHSIESSLTNQPSTTSL